MDRRILSIGCALILLAAATTVRAGEIHVAIAGGDQARVQELLRANPALLNAQDENRTRDYPIHTAATAGNVEIARLLLDAGANIEAEDADGSTPLHDAALVRKPEMVRFLLDRGADVNRRDMNGAYALSFAASGGDSACVRMVLDAGGDLYFQSANGTTLMQIACSRGMWWFAEMLRDRGADVNQGNREGDTPLHWAAMGRFPDHVRRTLALGARVDVRNGDGTTPFLAACWSDRMENAVILLENGADPNDADSVGTTPLIPVSRSGSAEFVRLLLSRGAKAEHQNSFGMTPLQSAVDRGDAEITALLLQAGAGLGYRDEDLGSSLLHLAGAYGHTEVARQLLTAGAELNAKDKEGRTPLDLAERYGNDGVARLLAGAGGERTAGVTHRPKRLAEIPKLERGEAHVWYLAHSGWAVKTRDHLLLFDVSPDERAIGKASDDPGLCNGAVDPAEIRGEKVIVFASHSHADHYNPAIFGWRESVPQIRYVFGFRPQDTEGYELIAPHETKVIDGVKIYAIESNDSGVGFYVEADGLTLYHAGDHANRFRDMSGPFKGEIDVLLARGVSPDLAFLPVSGCNFGDQVAVRIGNDYILEKMKPKAFFPMHGGKAGTRYREYITECKDRYPATQMLGAMCKGDQFDYRKGRAELTAR